MSIPAVPEEHQIKTTIFNSMLNRN